MQDLNLNSRRNFFKNSAKIGVASAAFAGFGGAFLSGCDDKNSSQNSASNLNANLTKNSSSNLGENSAKNSTLNSSVNSSENSANLNANSSLNLSENSAVNSTNSSSNSPQNPANSTKGHEMNFTKTAQQNYSKLFGDPANSAFVQSDPEFLEIYANFAFDEVFEQSGKIDLATRLKLILGACVGVGGVSEFKNIAAAALSNGVSAVEIKEIVYQATAYVGMARTLDFINAANDVFKAASIALPLPKQRQIERSQRRDKGLNAQRALFGVAIDKGNAAAPSDEQHIRTFLSANCFGDYYTRGGLKLEFRELLTFVILASFGGADAQVKAHVQGNLNIGHDRAYLIEVVTALVPYIGYPRSLNALAAIDALTLKA